MTREDAIAFEILMGVEASTVQDPENLDRFGVHMTDSVTHWTIRECLETMADWYDGEVTWNPNGAPEE